MIRLGSDKKKSEITMLRELDIDTKLTKVFAEASFADSGIVFS